MIWTVRKKGAKERAKAYWHDWFAWYPVRVPTKGRMAGQRKVWLQTIRRKGDKRMIADYDGCWTYYYHWYYALPDGDYDVKPKPKYAPMPECKPPREV